MIHNYKITVAGMKAHINVSDLAPGIYLYKLYTNEELSIAQGKFIVK